MIVRAKSGLTGEVHEMDLPITWDEWQRYQQGEDIQRVWPHFTADQREFLISGITKEEWDRFLPKEDS